MEAPGSNFIIPVGFNLRHQLQQDQHVIVEFAWSPDGRHLASPSFNDSIWIWDGETGEVIQVLEGLPGQANSLAWSPDGQRLASGTSNGRIQIWDTKKGRLRQSLEGYFHALLSLAWSPDGQKLASAAYRDPVRLWDTSSGKAIHTLEWHSNNANSITWSSDGIILATTSHDSTIRLWDVETGKLQRTLKGHDRIVNSLTWFPKGRILASASQDNTIRLWDTETGKQTRVLEGHTDSINGVSFSFDGRLLASKSKDGTIRFWSCDTWETVAILRDIVSQYILPGVCFHPRNHVLAALAQEDRAINIWELDLNTILDSTSYSQTVYYSNAKIVLVGDTGVGKSGLGLALTNQPFTATESTHGRCIWPIERQETELSNGRKETREILLWDLAGQPGYRLVHQLHLTEVALALVVFDARSETDPFAGVRYWARAIFQAQRTQGDSSWPIKKFLVAARTDRGGIGVSQSRIQTLISELGFDGFFETSAKENWDIDNLADAIRTSIDWETLPKVSSTKHFQKIMAFLMNEKEDGRLLSPADDLYRSFLQFDSLLRSKDPLTDSEETRKQFEACVGRIESRGLIRRLSFGELILLQPEFLDAYASAIINEARQEPDGMGSIAEQAILAGSFRMSKDERIRNRDQEKLLLIATVEELLRHEVTLREQADDGAHLVFPSQFSRVHPDFPDPQGKTVIFIFEGAILNIYATLVVRLAHSGVFEMKEMWKDAATYRANVGGACGVFLLEKGEGRAELTLFFDTDATQETRFQFEHYVNTHLMRRALPESVQIRRILQCTECSESISHKTAERRRERGFDTITCPVCNTEISLVTRQDRTREITSSIVSKIDQTADTRRDLETAASILQGKIATDDFDVFLAHNNQDKSQILAIAKHLKVRGIYPWIDKEQIPPGQWFQDVIQKIIPDVKSAAVFIGPKGLGKWQTLELRTFISQCVDRGIPVIPVLLPGVKEHPDNLVFLRELNWVKFLNSTDDAEALDDLEWGITGKQPHKALG